MNIYIALLLLVLPGFLTRKIYKQTNDIRENLDQFEETLYCLLNSLIVFLLMFILAGVISFKYDWAAQMFNLEILSKYFLDVKFVIKYFVVATLMSYTLGIFMHKLMTFHQQIINFVRKKKNLTIVELSNTIFDDMFHDNLKHFVEIYKDDKMIARGEIAVSNEKHKEFCLDVVEDDIDFIKKIGGELPHPKRIYYDGEKNIVIKEYNAG